jgi:uncharacterized protein YwqG
MVADGLMLNGLLTVTALTAALSSATPREDLAARAEALGLPNAGQIAADALPGARLVAGGVDAVGASRIGGDPDLPRGMKWPTCRGRKTSFLAQFPLADIARIEPGAVPADGTLTVFAGLIPDDDGVTRMEYEQGRVGRATCVLVRTLRGRFVRRSSPKRIPKLRSRPVRFVPTLTVPDWELARTRYGLTDEQGEDKYWKLEYEAAAGTLGREPDALPVHQLLGWPTPVQYPPLFGCGTASPKKPSHRLLLELAFDERLNFAVGDGGSLYLTGRPVDLRAGRFDRLCAEFQQG